VYLHESAASPEPRSDGVFYSGFGFLEYLIEMMVRPTGRHIRRSDAPWLHYYVGKPGLIGTGIYQRIAQEEHLQLRNSPQAGLIHEWRAAMGRLGWIRRSRFLDNQEFMRLWSRGRTTGGYGIFHQQASL
jgi:hypothetical protein